MQRRALCSMMHARVSLSQKISSIKEIKDFGGVFFGEEDDWSDVDKWIEKAKNSCKQLEMTIAGKQ